MPMEGPNISRVAALIGDPARANMLSALMDGRALTATELGSVAGVAGSTASQHLARLADGGLVRAARQGRHRYFTLAGADVAEVLEALMGLAETTTGKRVRTGPREPALRVARVCYDHLAGERGVEMLDGLIAQGVLAEAGEAIRITCAGHDFLARFGIDSGALEKKRRVPCRPCLDWSMRRNHLAGSLGAALWDRMQALGWARRVEGSREIRFAGSGEASFMRFCAGRPA